MTLHCPRCPKEFNDLKDFFDHIKRHDVVDQELKNKVIIMDECNLLCNEDSIKKQEELSKKCLNILENQKRKLSKKIKM